MAPPPAAFLPPTAGRGLLLRPAAAALGRLTSAAPPRGLGAWAAAVARRRPLPLRAPAFAGAGVAVRMAATATAGGGAAGGGGGGGTVGFLGLGIMGGPMASNLALTAGRRVVVWNRSPAKAEALAAAVAAAAAAGKAADGVTAGEVVVAATPAAVIEAADITYAMLSTPEAAAAVYGAPATGALAAVAAGKALVDCSTFDVATSVATAEAVTSRGGRFLEAPVSGSKVPAETGTLVFLGAGDRSLYDEVAGDLDAMGKRAFYLGPVGAGTRMKLVVNTTMITVLSALAEAVALTEATDGPAAVGDLLDVLGQGAMANPMFALKGPKMAVGERAYAANFPLEHAQKDLRFTLALAEEATVPMPVAAATNALFVAAKAKGLGRDDFCAVVEALRP
ncbi:hypothetical protein I4F81_003803 [Pyropia yezoensis]|uniref:Uncharacterized protein n=1 Tax=Pyropia yezoensis TaxID=2788 RepID=A0ACC3BU24_PYRYE|nr:hypothetical protein I4F81_003803 [Neopyropia yezoensis]